jgi:hypothetical protein
VRPGLKNGRLAVAAASIVVAATAVLLCVYPPLTTEVRQSVGFGQPPVSIGEGQDVSQTFRAVSDHVDGVALVVAKGPTVGGRITISLSPVGAASPKVVASRRVAEIGDWENVQWRFPRYSTTPGAEYAITVSADRPLYLAASTSDRYHFGTALTGSMPLSGDLIFRVYRRMEWRDLAAPAVGAPLGVAVLFLLVAAACAGWVATRLLQV